MLKDLIQSVDGFIYNDTMMYGLAAVALCAFVGFYYLGEYLFSDRELDLDFTPD